MQRRFRFTNNWICSVLFPLLCTACGPILSDTQHPNRHLLAQEQTNQGRYYTLEQAMTEAAAESLGQAGAANQVAMTAQKTATEAKQLAETVATGSKDIALSLEELKTSVAELQSRPSHDLGPGSQEPLKTFLVVLMRTPDAAMGLDAKGPDVRQLNLLLIVAGYLKESTVQDRFTKKTAAAVKALQADSVDEKGQPLSATGIFDDATAHALAAKLGATTAPLLIMTGTPNVLVTPNPLTRSEPSAAGPQRIGLPLAKPAASPTRP